MLVISGVVYLWRRFVDPGNKSASKTNTQKQREIEKEKLDRTAKKYDTEKRKLDKKPREYKGNHRIYPNRNKTKGRARRYCKYHLRRYG